MSDFVKLSIQSPEKYKAVIAKDSNGNEYQCYRCGCSGNEWKDSLTGNPVPGTIVEWKYV